MSRSLFAALLVLLLAGPLVTPVLTALCQPQSFVVFTEWERLGELLANTVLLALLAVLVAVTLGTVLAVAVARGPAVPARFLRAAVLVGLVVPIQVSAVAWQAVLGGWLPSIAPLGTVQWRPWYTGLLPAGWVHGMVAVPWVAWIVSGVLSRTDPLLEDDARMGGGWVTVLRRVVLPRAALATLVAGGWVTVQTATEMPVSDAMMVRTFNEEAYTQFLSEPAAEGRAWLAMSPQVGAAVAVTLPVWVAGAVAAGLGGAAVARRARVSAEVSDARPLVGRWWAAAGGLVVLLFAGVPLAALILKAAGGTATTGPRADQLFDNLSNAVRGNWQVLLTSVLWAAVAGVVTAWLARKACWHAARRRWFAGLLCALCVLLFLAPGPVVGFGLKWDILQLVRAEDWVLGGRNAVAFPPLATALYDQPSPLPVFWAAVVRLFPLACAVIWPAVRAIPNELYEAAAIDGGGARGEWRWVVAPLTRRAFAAAAVAVTALSLGEVSAGKLVAPPGYKGYILELFAQMHYGAEATVAALALVQLAVTAAVVGVGLAAVGGNENRRGRDSPGGGSG